MFGPHMLARDNVSGIRNVSAGVSKGTFKKSHNRTDAIRKLPNSMLKYLVAQLKPSQIKTSWLRWPYLWGVSFSNQARSAPDQ